MQDNKENQVYELGYLILPSVAEEGLPGIVDKLKGVIAKAKGEVISEETPIQIDLAYTMTKTVGASRYVVNDAYIGWVKFEAPKEGVPELQEEVANMDEVLRVLLIKAPRESVFTFAKAKEALEKANEPEEEAMVE